MTNKYRFRLLWVDDQIEGFSSFVKALEDSGFEVHPAKSTKEGLSLARTKSYNIMLVDIRMPPPDGIEFLRRVRPLQPDAILVVLSSYLYLDRYRDQLRKLDFAVELLDKDIPSVDAPDFHERFIDPIKEVMKRGVSNTIDSQDKQMSAGVQDDPFEITLLEFMRKPILEKDQLVLKARKIAATTIDKAFAQGKIWVLLCGSKQNIRALADNPGEILNEDQIMEFAISQQRAPYQFFKPVEVEDIWLDCGDSAALKDYPTVSLEFDDDKVAVHFDTGAPMTFYSYEELLKMERVRPTSTFALAKRGNTIYWATPLNIEVFLRCQRSDQKKSVHLTGQAVRDWLGSPFIRTCREKCRFAGDKSGKRSCPQRIGLIGRNLLVENALTLVLDGSKRQTGFELGD